VEWIVTSKPGWQETHEIKRDFGSIADQKKKNRQTF